LSYGKTENKYILGVCLDQRLKISPPLLALKDPNGWSYLRLK